MFQFELVRDEDVSALAEATLQVLEDVGILCQNIEILDALDEWGASVNRENQTVRFPAARTRKFIDQIRTEEERPDNGSSRRLDRIGLPSLGTQVAQFIYDYGKQETRSGNRDDLIELVKLAAALQDGRAGHSLLLTDVPPLLEPLEAAMVLAEYAPKPGPAFAWNVRQVDYLVEMGEILGIENWFTWGANCFAHPLRFDRDVADKFVRRARTPGASCGFTAMPVLGMSTPVTSAGFIAVSAAEQVATWICARSLRPDVGLGGSVWGASLDMRSGAVSYCAPDAMRNAIATVEFLRKWAGKTIVVGGGEYCDAKVPGYFAAWEKAYKAMTIAAFTGRHPGIGSGMLDEGRVLCPVQLLLERELALGVQSYARQVEVNPETIAMDTIREVGLASNGGYMTRDHSLEHFRDDTWLPPMIDRSGYAGPEQEEAVLNRLQNKVEELIASYEKPKVNPDVLARMRRVLDRAREELC